MQKAEVYFVSCAWRAKKFQGGCGYALLENLLNSLGMHCQVCHLSFKPCLLGASMLLLSAWANTIKKQKNWLHSNRLNIGRSSVPVKERIRNSRALLKAKRLSYLPEQCQCVRNACVGVRASDSIKMSETHAQCVTLESSGCHALVICSLVGRSQGYPQGIVFLDKQKPFKALR